MENSQNSNGVEQTPEQSIPQPVQPSINIQASPGQFGMNEQDVKNYQTKSILVNIKYYLLAIEPAFIKIFNTIFYWTLKFIKTFFSTVFKMILGKEV